MDTRPTADEQPAGLDEAPGRRKVFRRAVGVVAAGAAASALVEVMADPALATTKYGTAVVPAVVALTEKADIAVNAALGNDFRVTLTKNRHMNQPTNGVNGQQIIFQITQGPGAPHTLTWAAKYEFSAGVPKPTLSTKAGQTDLVGFIFNSTKAVWECAGFVGGFD